MVKTIVYWNEFYGKSLTITISDLVAEKVLYHNWCYLKFVKKNYINSQHQKSYVSKVMEDISAFLGDCSDIQFS